jgi:flavorubredoxin
MIVDPNDLRYDKRPRKKPIKQERINNMSDDQLDKNGVWQGTQYNYYEWAKEIIQDACDNQGHYVIDEITKNILNCIDQKRLEEIVSVHCENLEEHIGSDENRLGLLIKVKPKEDSIAKVTIKDTLSVL